MERASSAFLERFLKYVSQDTKILVLVGAGNNSGDGLAIARLLFEMTYNLKVVLVRFSDNLSIDCQKNISRMEDGNLEDIRRSSDLELLAYEVIIDAIFGSGLNRSVEGFVA